MSIPLSKLGKFNKPKSKDCNSCKIKTYPENPVDEKEGYATDDKVEVAQLLNKYHADRACRNGSCQGWLRWQDAMEIYLCGTCHDIKSEEDLERPNNRVHTDFQGINHKTPCMYPLHYCACPPDYLVAEKARIEVEKSNNEREAREGAARLKALIDHDEPSVPIIVSGPDGRACYMVYSAEKGKLVPAEEAWDYGYNFGKMND